MNHGRERGLGQAVEFVPPNLKAPEISGAFNQERDLLLSKNTAEVHYDLNTSYSDIPSGASPV